ncbi:uncharacterized protein [Parasteatoda tepidariorum]|uniref:uncharacterized protein n=1 Tax=Parasteatoda tepidariorum TaxID=114398 RepID=UPI0039BCCC93
MRRKNVVFERFKFFSCVQQEGQQVDSYLTELKTLASACGFGSQENDFIRDRLGLGIREKALLERLLRETDFTLQKAADFLRSTETSKVQLETVTAASQVHEIKRNHPKIAVVQKSQKSDTFKCYRCGKHHAKKSCPAFGRTCAKCKQKNHFAAVCKTAKPTQKSVNQIENTSDNASLFIDSLTFGKCHVNDSVIEDKNFSVHSLEKVWLTKVEVEG